MKNYHKVCALKILAGSGINSENVTLVDEDRNLNNCAGLKNRFLSYVGSGIATNTGLGLGNSKLYECRRLNGENVTLPGRNTAGGIFLNELEVIAKLICIKRNLLVGFGIHKVVEVAVGVKILKIATLNNSILKLCCGVEGSLTDSTGNNISVLGSYKCCALTGFNVLELNNLINLTLHFKGKTVLKIACCNHFFNPFRDIN